MHCDVPLADIEFILSVGKEAETLLLAVCEGRWMWDSSGHGSPGALLGFGTRQNSSSWDVPRAGLVTRGSADVSPLDDRPSSASQTTLVAVPFAVSAAAQAPALGTGSAA